MLFKISRWAERRKIYVVAIEIIRALIDRKLTCLRLCATLANKRLWKNVNSASIINKDDESESDGEMRKMDAPTWRKKHVCSWSNRLQTPKEPPDLLKCSQRSRVAFFGFFVPCILFHPFFFLPKQYRAKEL